MNKCAKSRAVSGDSDGSIRILLAVTNNPSRFSHAQACGGVAAAVAGAVETVPGAAGSCFDWLLLMFLLQKQNLLPILLLLWKTLPLQRLLNLCGRRHL
jgi:hypothetical protein